MYVRDSCKESHGAFCTGKDPLRSGCSSADPVNRMALSMYNVTSAVRRVCSQLPRYYMMS